MSNYFSNLEIYSHPEKKGLSRPTNKKVFKRPTKRSKISLSIKAKKKKRALVLIQTLIFLKNSTTLVNGLNISLKQRTHAQKNWYSHHAYWRCRKTLWHSNRIYFPPKKQTSKDETSVIKKELGRNQALRVFSLSTSKRIFVDYALVINSPRHSCNPHT